MLTKILLLTVAALTLSTPGGSQSQEGKERMNISRDGSGDVAGEHAAALSANHLAGETSPYLLQHALNPVDWYPWGKKALSRAKDENKPIFLSIGYSACHWCHVMERESFEDPDVAAILNAHFVSIKVDREERPDIDEIYMRAVQMMTGGGGWPLTVFLTPDLKPFFGGTYFPPEDRFGRPGFKRLAERIAVVWKENREEVTRSAEEATAAIRGSVESRPLFADGKIDPSVISRAAAQLKLTYDPDWGGFGQAPKFPPSGAIGILLREYANTGEKKLLNMAAKTLERMAYGGMYDQVGGGFHRYSTDRQWLVPHFEKMLYDNALLGSVYLEAWQVTHDDLYRRVAAETFDYVLREMTDSGGGFHSSLDADSEGEEGKFYVWSREEIIAILGQKDGSLFCEYYGVTAEGNFEGANILNIRLGPDEFAAQAGIPAKQLADRLTESRRKLRKVRDARVWPPKDDKVLAAWNGMMISALARGFQVLGEERLVTAAKKAAAFVLDKMVRDDVLLHTYRGAGGGTDGISKIPAYLDDYAEMANGLVDLYEATFELSWLEAANKLAGKMISDFYDAENAGFYFTSADHKNLLTRTKPFYDGAVPSGNSTAAAVLLRLSRLLDNSEYYEKAEATLNSMGETLLAQPEAYTNMLNAADFYLHPGSEIVLAGNRKAPATRRMLDIIHDRFIPNKIMALADTKASSSKAASRFIPLLEGKESIDDKTSVYVCENYACKYPVTDEEKLKKMLGVPAPASIKPGGRAGETVK